MVFYAFSQPARRLLPALLLLASQGLAALVLPQQPNYSLDISEQWGVYLNSDGQATIEDIRSQRYRFVPAAQFSPPATPLQNYWLRLELENPAPHKVTAWLNLDMPLTRNILLYQVEGPYIKTHGVSYSDNEGRQHRLATSHFAIAIAPQTTVELYLKLTRPWRSEFRASLSDTNSHLQRSNNSLLLTGVSYGAMGVLLLAALIAGYQRGRRQYWLLAFLIAAGIFRASIEQGSLLLLAPVNDSTSLVLKSAPLIAQALFLVALLLHSRCTHARTNTLRALRWSGVLAALGLLSLAPIDFNIAYFGLSLLEVVVLTLLLAVSIGALLQRQYGMLAYLSGLAIYALCAAPLLGGTLSPLTGKLGAGFELIAHMDGGATYRVGLLTLLLCVAATQLLFRQRGDATVSDPGSYTTAAVLEHLTGKSNPAWWRLTEAGFDGLMLCEHGRVVYANQAAAELVGHEKVEMIGKPLSLLLGSASDSAQLLEQATEQAATVSLAGTDGVERSLLVRARQQRVDNRPLWLTALRQQPKSTHDEGSFYDGLTGLPGRQLLDERIEHAISAASRRPARHALLALEVDRLQDLKQRYGQQRIDRLLQLLAARLQQSTRNENMVACPGRGRFLVFVEHIETAEVAARVALQLQSAFKLPVDIDERQLVTSAGVGIALYPADANTLSSLLQHAEQALHVALHAGPGSVRFGTESLQDAVARQLEREAARQKALTGAASGLGQALKSSSFKLKLTSIVDLHNQAETGLQAGLDWPGAPSNNLGVEGLYSLARHGGWEHAISKVLLDAACRSTIAAMTSANEVTLQVKVTASHFWQADFVEQLAKLRQECDCDPNRIMLVIDEPTQPDQEMEYRTRFAQLRQLGWQLGLENFAGGGGSISLVLGGELQQVALTPSWIKAIGTGVEDLAALRALVKFLHRLGVLVHVNQVGTQAQLKAVRMLGCDSASGPLFQQ